MALARPKAVPDIEDAGDDLLPGDSGYEPRDEAGDADAQAVSRIEAATGATSEGTTKTKEKKEEPRALRAKRPKLPSLPENLTEPDAIWPVRLKGIYFGKAIANVVATLGFDVLIPVDPRQYLGERAYTAGFLSGFLGEGVQLLKAPISVDAENRVNQKVSVRVPRYLNESTDQLLLSIAPLIGGRKYVEDLFALEWPWSLNVKVDIEGELHLFQMQQAFDLSSTAPASPGDLERERE